MKQVHVSNSNVTFFNASPLLTQLASFIGLGMEDEAKQLLKNVSQTDQQHLIASKTQFTDSSGKVFYCSVYEYAFWAKDTRMRRMLESYMNNATKAEMRSRCLHISQQGLRYEDNGEAKTTPYFDISELTNVINDYNISWEKWYLNNKLDVIKEAWLKVGLELRKAPAHFAQELCNSEKSIFQIPDFKADKLPRNAMYYNWDTKEVQNVFPLQSLKGLGYDFTIYQGGSLRDLGAGAGCGKELGWSKAGALVQDLQFFKRLDEVRTLELSQSLENLRSSSGRTCSLM